MIGIVDYGMGNIFSVLSAFEHLGANAVICSEPQELEKASKIVLPGVGAFPDCMAALDDRCLIKVLNSRVLQDKVPFLGICLGMQVLSAYSDENERCAGLGWLDSKVEKINASSQQTKIPNIGWETTHPIRESVLFPIHNKGKDFYFVHSYHMVCNDQENITSCYSLEDQLVVSSVQRDHVFGVQFHPEKSSSNGMDLLVNFLDYK